MMNHNHKILIIDDDEADRECYRRYLAEYNNIIEAKTGEQGINLCIENTMPDCILLDYILPDLDGLEVLARIHQEVKDTFVQIIFLTGHGNEYTAVKALTQGASDYLVKTNVNRKTLQETVSKALARKTEQLTKFQEEQEIFQKAFYDNLTGLYNKYAFYKSIEKLLESAKRHNRIFALLFIDLNKFKLINDTYNHHIGDLLLQQIGNRIKSRMRKEDIVARISGDEFAIALPEINDYHNAGTIAQCLLDKISEQCVVDGHRINITASIGISLYPYGGGQTVQELITNADNAMYVAKKQKISACHYSIDKFNTEFYSYNSLKSLVANEFKSKKFHVNHLLFYNFCDQSIFAYMPRITWSSEMLNSMNLCDVYKNIQKTGLLSSAIHEIYYSFLHAYENSDKKIIIKVNEYEFVDENFLLSLKKSSQKTKFNTQNIYLEIDSNTIFDYGETSYKTINSILEMNINIIIALSGIDNKIMDFFEKFPGIKIIKISKKIFSNHNNNCNDIMVRSISDIAHSIDAKIIFTEINDKETANYASSINAQIGQGEYLDSKYLNKYQQIK